MSKIRIFFQKLIRGIGIFIRGICAIAAIAGIIGLVLQFIGLVNKYVFGGDYSEWVIQGAAQEFFGLKYFILSLLAAVLGILGIGLGEWLEERF